MMTWKPVLNCRPLQGPSQAKLEKNLKHSENGLKSAWYICSRASLYQAPWRSLIVPEPRAASAHTPNTQAPAASDTSETVGQSLSADTNKRPLRDQSVS